VTVTDTAHTTDAPAPRDDLAVVDRPERPAGRGLRLARETMVAAGLAILGALWAMTASRLLFPFLSIDQDEAVYLLQADTFRHGGLFPPAPPHADAFTPWLSSQVGNHFVPKYTPVWPSVIAAAHTVTGSDRTALGLAAAAAVFVTYLLGREILGSRRLGLVAAVFLMLSPLFLVQSATFLSYVPNLVLLESAALTLLIGVRRPSKLHLVLSGLFMGLAVFARPFDAVLVMLPFVAWFLWHHRRNLGLLVTRGLLVVAGAIAPVLAMLAYFRAATGNPLDPPFSLTDASDTLGFGLHRVMPNDAPTPYGASQAVSGLIRHSVLTSFWCFGGLVLVALAVIAVVFRSTARERAVAAVGLVLPLGYMYFWGSNMHWDGPWRVGPFYYLPVLLPLTVLGAKGFVRLARWDRAVAVLAAASMAGVSGFVLTRAVQEQRPRTAELRALHAPLAHTEFHNALVFVPSGNDYLLTPFIRARNASLTQPAVWAVDFSADNLDAVADFPNRTPYLLVAEPGGAPALVPMRAASGPSITERVTVAPTTKDTVLHVVVAGRDDAFTLPASTSARTLTLTVSHRATQLTGATPTAHRTSRAADDTPNISLGDAGGAADAHGWVALDARTGPQGIEALLPTKPVVNGSLSVVAPPAA
jgi:hypothetical protein